MKTVGQILKAERLKVGFTLEQVERATHIRSKFLLAIEADDYPRMLASPYTQGFIKNYSEFLGLRSHTLLALFRRQFLNKEGQNKEPVEEPLIRSPWRITPNKVIAFLVIILIGSMFYYFYSQYRVLHLPPPLRLESPQEDQVVYDDKVPVYGDTDQDATLTINAVQVIVKEDGKFYKDIELNLGGNTLIIEARSRVGERTTLNRHVTRLANAP